MSASKKQQQPKAATPLPLARRLGERAHAVVLLHSAKHPWADALFGVLLAKGTSEDVVDALPLFHSPLTAPALEVAAMFVQELCEQNGLRVAGCYCAGGLGEAVARKAASQFRVDVLLVVSENNALALTAVESGAALDLKIEDGALRSFLGKVQQKKHRDLVDFEDHLQDPAADFQNPNL